MNGRLSIKNSGRCAKIIASDARQIHRRATKTRVLGLIMTRKVQKLCTCLAFLSQVFYFALNREKTYTGNEDKTRLIKLCVISRKYLDRSRT